MSFQIQLTTVKETSSLDNLFVNSNLVKYLLQIDIQKITEKIQWKIQTLNTEIFPLETQTGKTNIYYIHSLVLHCLRYHIHIGASGIQNPNPMTWISPKP